MPFVPLSPYHLRYYRIAQFILYSTTFLLLFLLILRSLFPTSIDSFDFQNPTSTKYSLFPPQNEKREVVSNGKLPQDTALLFDLGASSEDESATLKVLVEKNAPLPENLTFTLRHGYKASWLPQGNTLTDFPAEELYLADGVYYRLQDNKLTRFISRDAFLSRYPEEFAKPLTSEELKNFSITEDVLGFRPGLLTAYGDGVFIIMNEHEMRPVGSVRIFQDLGYLFEDVQTVNAEELGIYERGKIFLSGDQHPDGTLFQDVDSSRYYLIQDAHFHEVTAGRYLDFLLTKTHPVRFSVQSNQETLQCRGIKNTFSYGLHCTTPLDAISTNLGNVYEIRLENKSPSTDLRFFEARFKTAKNSTNLNYIISQIKDTLLSRFGLN